jgi:uncharacterized protein YjdB
MTTARIAALMAALGVTFFGCSDAGTDLNAPPLSAFVATVEIVAPPVMTLGTEGQLHTVLRDSKGNVVVGPLVTYSSNDSTVLHVTLSGRARALSPGDAEVTATAAGKKRSSTIKVPRGRAGQKFVRVTPGDARVPVGQVAQLTAEVADESGNVIPDQSITWATSDPKVATVNSDGEVTTVAPGSVTVTASSEGASPGNASVVVDPEPSPVPPPGRVSDLAVTSTTQTEVSIQFTQVSDGTGEPASYQVRWGPAPSTNWGGMTPVSAGTCAGVVQGTAVGQQRTCTVAGLTAGTSYDIQLVAYRGSMADGSAVFGEYSNSVRATTAPPPTVGTLTITPKSATLDSIGATQQFTATAQDGSGNTVSNPGVTWTSSNTGIATVSNTGVVTARGAGMALITAIAACCGTDTATITVQQRQPVGTVFHSDWSHATGTGWSVLSDGGKWSQEFWCTGTDQALSVVTGAALGWTRTPNVFRTTMRGGTGSMCGAIQHRDVVPASTTHWGRLYFRNDESIWGGAMHNYSYNFVGDIQMVYFRPNGESAGWFLGFSFDYAADGASWSTKPHPEWARGNWVLQTRQANATSPSDFTGATSPNRILMDHGAWYRYEWMVEYITPTSFRFWPRLYNAAGTLLYDASNFFNIYHLTASLSEYYAGGGAFGTSSTALMRHIGIGNEGRPGPDTGNHWYTADFAISLDGWIGSR